MELNSKTTVGDLRKLMDRREFAHIRDRMRAVIERRRGKIFVEIAILLDRSVSFVKEWNDRFKVDGALGLLDRAKGNPRTVFLQADELEKFRQRILAGPIAADGISSFRNADFQKILANEFSVSVGKNRVSQLLKEMNLSLIRPRPRHEKQDPKAIDNWKSKTFPLF